MNDMGLKDITTKGKTTEPPFFLIHGLGGVGKTTFAASLQGAFFIDTENSTAGMNVARSKPDTFEDILSALRCFYLEEHEYKNLIIDTLDWAEKKAVAEVCKEMKVKSPADVAFGKAWGRINAKMVGLLNGLIACHEKGYGIVVLAHSQIITYKNPLGDDFDMIRIKCRNDTSELFRERPQLVGYMHRQVITTESDSQAGFTKKVKAVVVKNSSLSCVPNAVYDAKNRFGITDDIIIPAENGWAAVQAAINNEALPAPQ